GRAAAPGLRLRRASRQFRGHGPALRIRGNPGPRRLRGEGNPPPPLDPILGRSFARFRSPAPARAVLPAALAHGYARSAQAPVLAGVDLFPSLAKLVGAPVPDNLDGEDLSAAWLGKEPVRKKLLFWEYGRKDDAYQFAPGADRSPNVAVRDGKWMLLVNADGT